jgi:lactoylglutathione lyase
LTRIVVICSEWADQKKRDTEMTTSEKYVDVIILLAADLERSKASYQDVFGLAVDRHNPDPVSFRLGEMIITLLDTRAARDLVAPAKVAGREAGSRLLIGMLVDDVDAVCTMLLERGVPLLNGPADRASGKRTACFADPAGHAWEVAQGLRHVDRVDASADVSDSEKTEKDIGEITLFVNDLDRAKWFYQNVFGLPVDADNNDSACLRLENTSATLLECCRGARAHRARDCRQCRWRGALPAHQLHGSRPVRRGCGPAPAAATSARRRQTGPDGDLVVARIVICRRERPVHGRPLSQVYGR